MDLLIALTRLLMKKIQVQLKVKMELSILINHLIFPIIRLFKSHCYLSD